MEYRKITLDDWVRKGEGNTAESYFHKTDKTIMLKLFTGSVTSSRYAVKEMKLSREVERCGIATPRAIEIVTCEGRIGIIYERIPDKVSFSRLIADDNSNLIPCAKYFAEELKVLHSKTCDIKNFPSIKSVVTQGTVSNRLFSKKTKAKILDLVEKLGDSNHCLHGDPQTGNLVMSNGKKIWIDLGAFTHGNEWYDIGGVYFFYKQIVGRILSRKILHMTFSQLSEFWKQFVYAYTGDKTKENYKEFTRRAKKCCLLFSIYTMDVEHYTGFTNIVASLVIRLLVWGWKDKPKQIVQNNKKK